LYRNDVLVAAKLDHSFFAAPATMACTSELCSVCQKPCGLDGIDSGSMPDRNPHNSNHLGQIIGKFVSTLTVSGTCSFAA
jgi:hypothetical protein